jgi:hypothetical protein
VQGLDEVRETFPANLVSEPITKRKPEMAISRATLLRVAFESPSVRVRKIGAIPGALIIGVRVAKTTNAFCSRSVKSGAVMRGRELSAVIGQRRCLKKPKTIPNLAGLNGKAFPHVIRDGSDDELIAENTKFSSHRSGYSMGN